MRQSAADNDQHKIFVGGLPRDVDEPQLKLYFDKFGEVTECEVKKSLVTMKSRGFGFVKFKDFLSV